MFDHYIQTVMAVRFCKCQNFIFFYKILLIRKEKSALLYNDLVKHQTFLNVECQDNKMAIFYINYSFKKQVFLQGNIQCSNL